MKNVYDIRKENKYFFILSDKIRMYASTEKSHSIGIFVNLYYEDDADLYLDRLYEISKHFCTYIISSKTTIIEKARAKGFFTIQKENRGRDLSALLVAAREIIASYEYICFIHDKKTAQNPDRLLIKEWRDSLWNNTLVNSVYIDNVINVFYQTPSIGLLLPPEYPCSERWKVYGTTLWTIDYDNIKKLLSDFDINCNIRKSCPPISIGTVFWCRTKALHILFEHEWKYSDFPAEPMNRGGTISHALERCFPYFAQSEGFETGTIMTEFDAASRIALYSDVISQACKNEVSIENFYEMIDSRNRLTELIAHNKDLYLFGAGKIGKKMLYKLLSMDYTPKGIIVSKKEDNPSEIASIPIYALSEITDKNSRILVCVGKKNMQEVMPVLCSRYNRKNLFLI